jgi:hypothetical protein
MVTLRPPGGGVLAQAASKATRPTERAVSENREGVAFFDVMRASLLLERNKEAD